MAHRFRKAGVIETPEAMKLLETIARCAPAMLDGALKVADELVGGELVRDDKPTVPTFADLGKLWTDGDLHRLYPDHVALKDAAQDGRRLAKLSQIDVGGIKLGDIPLDRFTLDHAQAAMRQLPEDAKRPATCRQYAQVIGRVLALAVFPCRAIERPPLPRGFLPKVGKPPRFPYLYPDEDTALLAHKPIPLVWRIL